ncbi:MAG: ABC transporter permease, partial [Armatimonadota bacterium]|nr:ABC transporter permease [Armatimonadota bacterium]
MARYAARRLALLLPVVLSAAVVTFALLLLLPGDPAVALLGQEASPEELSRFRHLLGLDRPVLVQLGLYLWRVARADFGRSITLDVPVLR